MSTEPRGGSVSVGTANQTMFSTKPFWRKLRCFVQIIHQRPEEHPVLLEPNTLKRTGFGTRGAAFPKCRCKKERYEITPQIAL